MFNRILVSLTAILLTTNILGSTGTVELFGMDYQFKYSESNDIGSHLIFEDIKILDQESDVEAYFLIGFNSQGLLDEICYQLSGGRMKESTQFFEGSTGSGRREISKLRNNEVLLQIDYQGNSQLIQNQRDSYGEYLKDLYCVKKDFSR